MQVKYIEYENPFDAGGKTRLKVERETKTRYVVRYNDRAVGYYKKHPTDKDGSFVRQVPRVCWDRLAKLVIVEE